MNLLTSDSALLDISLKQLFSFLVRPCEETELYFSSGEKVPGKERLKSTFLACNQSDLYLWPYFGINKNGWGTSCQLINIILLSDTFIISKSTVKILEFNFHDPARINISFSSLSRLRKRGGEPCISPVSKLSISYKQLLL